MADFGYGDLALVLINVALFGAFILFISFRRKIARLPTGIYLAFVVALYTEMYGFPLTIYILSWLFGYQNPLTHIEGHILAGFIGENVFFSVFHPLSDIMMVAGALLIFFGWTRIHGGRGRLVTDGLYSFTRHPQYLGILVLTLGMIVQWATILTLLMWPILLIVYYRLAREEEKEMEGKFGETFKEYKTKVPMFFPLKL